MNSIFTAKYLQALRNKKGNKGFTLIELLVVVIIIGVLAAVALPNLLAQVGKAREVEGKTGVGTITRSQQTRHFETGSFEAVNDTDLESISSNNLSITVDSEYFDFGSTQVGTTALTDSIETTAIAPAGTGTALDTAQANGTRALGSQLDFSAGNYTSIMCQTNVVSATKPVIQLNATTSVLECGTGATEIR